MSLRQVCEFLGLRFGDTIMATQPVKKTAAPAPAARPAAAAPSGDAAMKALLAKMAAKWDQAKAESKKSGMSADTTMTAGRHIAQLTDAVIQSTAKGLMVKFTFTGVEPDEEIGETAIRMTFLTDDDKIVYLQRDLRRMGVDQLDDLEPIALPEIIKALKESAPIVRLTVKESGDYMNVYIDKLAEDGEAAAPAADTEGETAEAEATEAEATETTGEEEVAAEETETPAEEPGLAVGDNVVTAKGTEGTVTAIDEAAGTVTIKKADGKLIKAPIEGLTRVVEAQTDEVPEEEVVEEETQEVQETFEVGDSVVYLIEDPKTKKQTKVTGKVVAVNDQAISVKDDKTKKVGRVAADALTKLVTV